MRAIDVTGVRFTYDDGTEALCGVDFHVSEGEFVAVLGSNGSGKTTLIGLLVGLLKAKAGQVCIGGREIGSLSTEELYQRVGLVFQNPTDQLFAATVEEDVAF
ncbi:MAG: ATP-binding cassette domain-containing protein, partial [Deltaproteobacteria bacterium]|nr:ATP-binding cassette domain-containing protein [Deltaproteobacteria bacterium]